MRGAIILLPSFLLAACASGSIGSGAPRSASATTLPPASQPVLVPSKSVRQAGLQTIIGANAPALLKRFGDARIDLREGSARKLQFAGDQCVIDIFLYPLQSGQEPVATHIEARNRQTGAASDKSACAEILAKAAMR